MTSRTKQGLNVKNEAKILEIKKARNTAGNRAYGPGTSTNTRPNTGLKRRN